MPNFQSEETQVGWQIWMHIHISAISLLCKILTEYIRADFLRGS